MSKCALIVLVEEEKRRYNSGDALGAGVGGGTQQA